MGGYSFSDDIGDGSKVTFPFAFIGPDNGYFDDTDIFVTVDGVNTAFTLTGPTQVTLGVPPTVGSKVRVRRVEDTESPYSSFSRGNQFGKETLNKSFQQQLYVSHMLLDGFKEAGYYEKQDLSLGGNKITGLGTGVSPSDAVNLNQVTDEIDKRIEEFNVNPKSYSITLPSGGAEVLDLGFEILGSGYKTQVFADGVLQHDAFPSDGAGLPTTEARTTFINLGSLLPEGVDVKVYVSAPVALGNETYFESGYFNSKLSLQATSVISGRLYKTLGYHIPGKGGGEYLIVPVSVFGDPDGWVNFLVNGGSHVAVLQWNGYLHAEQGGAIGDGVADDTQALQACIDCLSEKSTGGTLLLGVGTYLVYNSDPTGGGSTQPQDAALYINKSNVSIKGVGWSSILKAKRDLLTTPKFIMIRLGVIPIVNGEALLYGNRIEDLSMDGSYEPVAGEEDLSLGMLLWVHGVHGCLLNNLYMRRSPHYGIGLQNGGHVDCTLSNILIENVVADGIDVKNNGNIDTGNKMSNISVRRFGRAYNASAPYAGIDIMGEWSLSGIYVSEYGTIGSSAAAGVRFKQGELVDDRGIGGNYSTITNFRVDRVEAGYMLSDGVRSQTRNVHISNGTIRGCPDAGVSVTQEGCSVSGVQVYDSTTGFEIVASPYTTNADYTTLSRVTAEGCDTGFVLGTEYISMSKCSARDCALGANIGTNATNLRWAGGNLIGNTANISNSSGSARLLEISGFKNQGESTATVDASTTGFKTIVITHGLDVKPRAGEVSLRVWGGGAGLRYDTLKVLSVETTTITVGINITTVGLDIEIAAYIDQIQLVGL